MALRDITENDDEKNDDDRIEETSKFVADMYEDAKINKDNYMFTPDNWWWNIRTPKEWILSEEDEEQSDHIWAVMILAKITTHIVPRSEDEIFPTEDVIVEIDVPELLKVYHMTDEPQKFMYGIHLLSELRLISGSSLGIGLSLADEFTKWVEALYKKTKITVRIDMEELKRITFEDSGRI